MDRISRFYRKYNKGMRITAALLIGCMLFADASLYLSLTSDNLPYTNSSGGTNYDAEKTIIVNENHLMDVAMADGKYDGNNSDSENHSESSVSDGSGGKRIFNILEILPTEKKAFVGYTIGGCEPFTDENDEPVRGLKSTSGEYIATPQQMREAYMDAVLNANPGDESVTNNTIENNSISGLIKKMNEGIVDSGPTQPLKYEIGTYNGYYKYVGGNKGVYCIDDKNSSNPKIYSKFYTKGRSDYNYIFVYSDAESTSPSDVNVVNQKRVKYTNNEKFLKDSMGIEPANIQEWKDGHQIEVTTRTPSKTTLSDIERADVIIINNAVKKDFFIYANQLNNILHGRNADYDKSLTFSDQIDFDDFEKVIRIYERAVVREDVALVADKQCGPNNVNNGIKTNMNKLIVMLFYAQKGGIDAAGREIFTDYLKRYTSEPGSEYIELRRKHKEDPEKYPTDYRAMSLKETDDDSNPRFYYMHMHNDWHVGHPLVLSEDDAKTGGSFDNNGILEASFHDTSNMHTVTLERLDTFMFEDAGIPYYATNKEVKDGSKYYSKKTRVLWPNYVEDNNGEYILIPAHSAGPPTWAWINDEYIIPSDGNYNGKKRYRLNTEDYYEQDASGDYVYENGKYVLATTVYTKEERVYCYDGTAYESMSNTTDFVYIDNNGNLIVDNKYSSDQGDYWYKIDYDGGIGGEYAYRRIIWDYQEYSAWPWDYNMSTWFFKRKDNDNNPYHANLHMWYDYNGFRGDSEKITAKTNDNFGSAYTYKNTSIGQENELFKGSLIHDAIEGRTIKREETDDTHVINNARKDYYISMNILNGDGVNKNGLPGNNNKTLYYNQYEKDDIQSYETANGKARIPINIRIKSSCKLLNIKVYDGSTGSVIATYPLNIEVTNENEINSSGGRGLKLTRPASSLDENGKPKDKTSGDGTIIHTFEGSIYDVMSSYYLNKRNEKIIVELNAEAPDGSTKSIQDTITIVKRDFFMLD